MTEPTKVEEIVAKVLGKKEQIRKLSWIVQLLIGIPALVYGYQIGHHKVHLILFGSRIVGTVVATKEVRFQRSKTGSTTEYLPIVEFELEGKKYSFTGDTIANSNSNNYQIDVLVDKNDPEIAMQNHPAGNWIPWSFFISIGVLLSIAGLTGAFRSFIFRSNTLK